MEETVLKTMARTDNPKKVRDAGFIPGVLNGPGTESTSVQFETAVLNKILSKHGSNAKIWVEMDGDKKFGFIKEVQRRPMDRNVIHVAIQLVSADQEVKMQLPLSFHGRDELEHRQLQVHVLKSEIDVTGRTALMPDSVSIDVSSKELGDTITANDFVLPEGIVRHDSEQEIYAVIRNVKGKFDEEPEAEKPDVEALPVK